MKKRLLFLFSLLLLVGNVVAQDFDTSAKYRIKVSAGSAAGEYVTIGDNIGHPFGYVHTMALDEANSDQIFSFISSNGNWKVKSNSGEYFYVNNDNQGTGWNNWNLNKTENESIANEVSFESTGNTNEYYLKIVGKTTYFKVGAVDGGASSYYHVYFDANESARNKFVVEKIDNVTPEPEPDPDPTPEPDPDPTPEPEGFPVKVTEVGQLSNNVMYTIISKDTGRGNMYALSSKVDMCAVTYNQAQTCHGTAYNPEDPNQQFAFVKHDGKFYLYSVGQKKFIGKSGNVNHLTDAAPFDYITVTEEVAAAGEDYFSLFINDANYITASPGWCSNASRNTCLQTTLTGKNSSDGWDDGAWFTIMAVGEFNPAEALALLNPSAPVGPSEAEVTALLETAQQALALNGVGYPVEAEREVVEIAMAALEGEATQANYDELVAKLTAYATTTNIQMPESGKAYRIKAKYSTGSYKYMYRTDAGKMQVTTTEPSGYNGTFIFKKNDDGTYAVVNNYGEYMTYYADGKTGVGNTNDGFADQYKNGEYNADMKFIVAVDKTPTNGTKDSWVGCFLIQGRNTSGDGGNNYYYLMAGPNSDFHNAQANDIFYSAGNLTSVFYLEEVAYPNTPELKAADGLDVAAIATYSAPFATVVPEGVTAWYAQSEGGDYVSMTEVEGAIPANTGVVLTSETTGTVTMVPAAAEELATVSGNLLSAAAAAGDCDVEATTNAYVIGKADGVVAFYPLSATNRTIAQGKSFLVLPTASPVVKMNFGGESTAIETVEKVDANAPIYDLSGRRVVNMTNGGVYIQNGKKFIVK